MRVAWMTAARPQYLPVSRANLPVVETNQLENDLPEDITPVD